MTWKEKADEIAADVFKGMSDNSEASILNALRQAAIKGMEFDSYNWCHTVR